MGGRTSARILAIVRSRPRQPATRRVRLVQPGFATSRRCCSLDFPRKLIGSLGCLLLAPLVALPALAAQSPDRRRTRGVEVRRPADPIYIILPSPADLDALLKKIAHPDWNSGGPRRRRKGLRWQRARRPAGVNSRVRRIGPRPRPDRGGLREPRGRVRHRHAVGRHDLGADPTG